MFAIIMFALLVLVLCYVFYLRRKRESAAFREANFADFVEFDRDRSGSVTDHGAANEIAAGVISAAAAAIEQRKGTSPTENIEAITDCLSRDKLFDATTRALLASLYQVIGDSYLVLHRVPVSELLIKTGGEGGSVTTTGSEKVDFVICRRVDLKAVCCIQHSGGGVEKLSRMFRNSGLPFMHLAVGPSYSEAELRDLLKDILVPADPIGHCRNCHQAMVVKRVSSGKNEGQYFWVCSACKLNSPVR